jgi:HlyD family secretion protein
MERLVAQIERSFEETEQELADPTVLGDHQRLAEVGRTHRRLQAANELAKRWRTATATIATQNTGNSLLVPNAALRFRPDTKEESSDGVFNPQIGLEDQKQQASIGVGSRQQVQVLQADGTLKAIEVVTGRSDWRRTVVRSKELKPGMKVVTGVKAAAP